MTLSQASLFDFNPVPEKPKQTIALKDKYEEDGLYHVYRSDAQSFIDSLGTYYDGKARSDTRILENHYHGDLESRYYSSAEPTDEDWFLESWLQMFPIAHKDIGPSGVRDILSLSTYNPIDHNYDHEYRLITGGVIEGDVLRIITDKSVYTAVIDDDRLCERYRVAHYDPTFYMENFVNEGLRHGIPAEEFRWFAGHHAYGIECYSPFTRDWNTGKLVMSEEFVKIGEIADRIGIQMKFQYGPRKPEPEKWSIYPAYQDKYCVRAKGCKQKKETCGCTCCPKFLYNRMKVDPKHLNDPTAKKKPKIVKEWTDDCCEEEEE